MGIYRASEAAATICHVLLAVPGLSQRGCIGPDCGAWRWAELTNGAGSGFGYCGLAGEPINFNHQQTHEITYNKNLVSQAAAAETAAKNATVKTGKGGGK